MEMRRIVRPSVGGVEYNARMASEPGNSPRVSATDLPNGQMVKPLQVARVVDSRLEKTRQQSRQFDATDLRAIAAAMLERYRRHRL